MIDELTTALAALDPATRRRLQRCVPSLVQALADFDGYGTSLTIAVATPNNAGTSLIAVVVRP